MLPRATTSRRKSAYAGQVVDRFSIEEKVFEPGVDVADDDFGKDDGGVAVFARVFVGRNFNQAEAFFDGFDDHFLLNGGDVFF